MLAPDSERQTVSPGPPPRSVVHAVWLLWTSLAVGLVELALSMNPLREPAQLPAETHMTAFGVFASIVAIGTAYLWIVHHVRKGRNWARVTVLVLVVLGVIDTLTGRRSAQPLPFMLNLAEILLDVAALTLLFREPASHWFNPARR